MGSVLNCCRQPDAEASGDAALTCKDVLSEVDVAGDTELGQLLENLREAAALHTSGQSWEAVERFEEARGLMDQLRESPEPGIKRSESLNKIRVVCDTDPTFCAIQAEIMSSSHIGPADPMEEQDEPHPVQVECEQPDPLDPVALQDKIERLLVLCREARVFEAAAAHQQLRQDLDEASRRCEPDSKGEGTGDAASAVARLRVRVQGEPILAALRATNERMRRLLSRMSPQVLPAAGGKDSKWVHTVIKDPAVGKDFVANIHLRFTESKERDKDGPSTQLTLCGQLNQFPLALPEFISVYRETDLYRKEWIADAEKCEGGTSGPERCYSSYSRILNASPILPMRLEVLTVREFAVCTKPPLAGHRSGVLVSDMSPPSDTSEYCGWQLPTQPKKCIRLSNIGLVLYFVPNEANPSWSDVFAFCRVGVPAPQWIVPISLVKTFLAHHFLSVFKSIKIHIADKWNELDYGARITACPDFYGPIAELQKKKRSSVCSAQSA
mmetsp:Transcript_107590/g.335479  ORF Transcript_107590/g.335479 Transcript_107590/m.335479 type:complete len:497 (+) Transcript_107590:68-1558(+)